MFTKMPFTGTPTTVTIKIGRTATKYVLAETTTPRPYDYGTTIQLGGAYEDGSRFVLIPAAYAERQLDNYHSSAYPVATLSDVFSVGITEMGLWDKLCADPALAEQK